MVASSNVYLFVGQDYPAKRQKIAHLKKEMFGPEVEDFNFDLLYAKDATVKKLRERLMSLPTKNQKRMVWLKDVASANASVKAFLSEYVRSPYERVILILDFEKNDPQDNLLKTLKKHGQIFYFKERPVSDAFDLAEAIKTKDLSSALVLLHRLLSDGHRPETILGGLRSSLENYIFSPVLWSKAARYLLLCDIELKTTGLRPREFGERFALEKLLVRLHQLLQLQR